MAKNASKKWVLRYQVGGRAEDETHFPRTVIEQAMGHQVGTEVERAYRRTDVLEKRRALMSDWSAYIAARAQSTR